MQVKVYHHFYISTLSRQSFAQKHPGLVIAIFILTALSYVTLCDLSQCDSNLQADSDFPNFDNLSDTFHVDIHLEGRKWNCFNMSNTSCVYSFVIMVVIIQYFSMCKYCSQFDILIFTPCVMLDPMSHYIFMTFWITSILPVAHHHVWRFFCDGNDGDLRVGEQQNQHFYEKVW